MQKILEGFSDWDVQPPVGLMSWRRRGLPTQVYIERDNVIFLSVLLIGVFSYCCAGFDRMPTSGFDKMFARGWYEWFFCCFISKEEKYLNLYCFENAIYS